MTEFLFVNKVVSEIAKDHPNNRKTDTNNRTGFSTDFIGCDVQDVDYAALRERLLADGQRLDPPRAD